MPGQLVVAETAALSPGLMAALRRLWDAAFTSFDATDADHALGGVHAVVLDGAEPLAHASVVPRRIRIGEEEWDAGYVEAVCTRPDLQGTGLGTRVMRALDAPIRVRHHVGMLATGSHGFYERLGWERWQGPSWVLTATGPVRSEEDDDALMVLRFGRSAAVDLTAPVTCEDRPGDPW